MTLDEGATIARNTGMFCSLRTAGALLAAAYVASLVLTAYVLVDAPTQARVNHFLEWFMPTADAGPYWRCIMWTQTGECIAEANY